MYQCWQTLMNIGSGGGGDKYSDDKWLLPEIFCIIIASIAGNDKSITAEGSSRH